MGRNLHLAEFVRHRSHAVRFALRPGFPLILAFRQLRRLVPGGRRPPPASCCMPYPAALNINTSINAVYAAVNRRDVGIP